MNFSAIFTLSASSCNNPSEDISLISTNFIPIPQSFSRVKRAYSTAAGAEKILHLVGANPKIISAILSRGEALARCYFADNDLIAAGAMKAFIEAGYKIPKDVGFAGFDNIPLCTLMSPNLSSIDVPKAYLSSLAVERLISIMKTPLQPPVSTLLTTQLIIRTSSIL